MFETEPLEEDIEMLGAPVVELEVEVDRPVALVAVRLSDVLPDDRATRVTYGLLNLTHRHGHEHPERLEPGERYRVRVRMNDIAQNVPAGHRLRLSVSTVYWPLAWPAPEPVRLTVHPESSRTILPIRPVQPENEREAPFGPPEMGPPLERTIVRMPEQSWSVVRDLVRDESRLEVVKDVGVYRIDAIDLEIETRATETYSFRADDYESLRGETWWTRRFKRGEWEVRTVAHTVLTSDADEFRVRAQLDAYEGDARIHSISWDERIERDHV